MDLAPGSLVWSKLSMDGWYGMDWRYDNLAWSQDGSSLALDASRNASLSKGSSVTDLRRIRMPVWLPPRRLGVRAMPDLRALRRVDSVHHLWTPDSEPTILVGLP